MTLTYSLLDILDIFPTPKTFTKYSNNEVSLRWILEAKRILIVLRAKALLFL